MRYLLLLLLVTPLIASTLGEVVSYGLRHSPLILSTKASQELSRLTAQESKAQRYGELNLVGDYTHYNIERTLAPLPPSASKSGEPIVTTKDLFTTGLSYSVPLFTGYAQTRQVEIDEISQSLSRARLKLTKEQLAYNIRTLYLNILSQQALLKAQKHNTKTLKRLALQIKKELSIGRRSQIEYLKAQADLSASTTQEELLHANIEMSIATLSAVVGKKISHLSSIKINIKKPRYNINKLSKRLKSLSRVGIEDMQIKKADKQIQKAKSASLPQIQLNGYIGNNFGKDLASDEWESETVWQVGIKGQYNILDFGKRAITTEKARVAKLQAAIHKQQILLDAKKLLIEAVEKIKLSYIQYRGSLSQYKLSKKSLQIEQVRYDNDSATINDLLLAKSKANLAMARLIQNKYSYQSSIYYLDYILERGIK